MYLLTCRFPCSEVKDFRKDAMRPYRVSDEAFQRGYADQREYDLIPAARVNHPSRSQAGHHCDPHIRKSRKKVGRESSETSALHPS
jgi:hypothetical protein